MTDTPPEDDIAQLAAQAFRNGDWDSTADHVSNRGIDADVLTSFVTWSRNTFGPDALRTEQLTAHIRKELAEILADPTDTVEWVDVMILAFDGAWRSAQMPSDRASALYVAAAFLGKVVENFNRQWPDWRTVDPSTPVEHVRDGDGT